MKADKSEQERISRKCLKIVSSADRPLHTEEIAREIPWVTNHKTKMALIRLMSGGHVKGHTMDVGRGVWIWWRKDAFGKVEG